MNLEYFLLDDDQIKPDIRVTQPLRYSYLIKNALSLDEIISFTNSLHELPWRVQEIIVAGQSYMPKRETLGMSAPGSDGLLKDRSFYGLTYPDIVQKVRSKVINIIDRHISELELPNLNFCWGNRYRTGNDKVGKHKDNEKWHSEIDPIVSVSFGEYRHFDVHDDTKKLDRFDLGFGDIFLMMPGFQDAYYHSVPVQKKVSGSRINLTFRSLIRPPSIK